MRKYRTELPAAGMILAAAALSLTLEAAAFQNFPNGMTSGSLRSVPSRCMRRFIPSTTGRRPSAMIRGGRPGFSSSTGAGNSSGFPGRAGLPEIPRLGMRLVLPTELDTITWFGRGPHENYSDRKTSAFVGVYDGSVADQIHPYIRPQKTGYMTDVRWIAFTDPAGGAGLWAAGSPLVCAWASRFFAEDYEYGFEKSGRHTIDMKPRDLVVLNVDYGQRGLGGDNSWGAVPHDPYQLLPKSYAYAFRLRAFDPETDSPWDLYRRSLEEQRRKRP